MNLIIMDPNLAHPHGHHMEWDLAIAGAAKERGQNVVIYANRECTLGNRDGIEVIPWFTYTSYETRHKDPVTGQFDDFRFFNDRLAAELSLIPAGRLKSDDMIVVPTLTEINALGYVAWAKTFDPLNAPLIVLYLMFPSGIALHENGTSFDIVDPIQAMSYKLAHRLAVEDGTPIKFFGGGRQLAREFAALFEAEVKPHPIPNVPARKPGRGQDKGQHAALLFAGDAKVDKGFALVPELADRLAKAYPEWTFVIHANAGAAWGQALEAYQDLLRVADAHPNIRLRTGRLTREDYFSLLGTSDCLVSTYDPVVYARKSSGVLWEAVSLGMVAVVPGGTWLENEAKEWGAGYRAYPEPTVDSICEAFENVAADMDGLVKLSMTASSRYHAFNGVDRLLNQLGMLWAPRALEVALSKQPAAKVLSVADLEERGWHYPETSDGLAVRWTDKEFMVPFDWPFKSAWELRLAVKGFIASEQLRDARVLLGGEEIASTKHVGENGDSYLVATAPGPGRSEPRQEVVVRLPWAFRPDRETRDLGLLVCGVEVKPSQSGSGEAAAAKPLEILSPITFTPDGSAFQINGAVSGLAIVDPNAAVSISFVLHSGRGAEFARQICVHVNGIQVPIEVFALDASRWQANARIPHSAVLLRGFQIEWDLLLHVPAHETVLIGGLTFDNETVASPDHVRANPGDDTPLDDHVASMTGPDERSTGAVSANAQSFSKMLEERAAVRGSLSTDRSGYVEAGVGTAMASAEALQLDGYFAGSADWSHLEISMYLVSLQGESWSQVKFKFCIEQGRPLLEFRRLAGWPEVFETWFGTGEDQFSPYVHVTAEETFADLRLSRRDFLLLQAIAKLLPNVVERAISLPEWRISNSIEWIKIAKIASRDWLTKIAAQHGALQAELVARE